MMNSIKIGIRFPVYGKFPTENPFDLIKELVVKADIGGVDSVWMIDHFYMTEESIRAAEGKPGEDGPLESWTTLSAAAAWTKNVMIGTEVTPVTFRHPAILAKMVATVDLLSNGRAILGAGSGWLVPEYKTLGIPFYKSVRRTPQMIEAIKIIRMLWTQDEVNFEGAFYKLKGAKLFPKPVQKPCPPIWFGGKNDPILDAVAKYGEGFIPPNNFPPIDFKECLIKLKKKFDNIGRHFDDLIPVANFLTHVAKSHEVAERSIDRYAKMASSGDPKGSWSLYFGQSKKYGIWGTPKECIAHMQKYVDLGAKHFILDLVPPYTSRESLELICDEIVPHFKK